MSNSRRTRIVLVAMLVAGVALSTAVRAQIPADTLMGHDLLVNGNAEADQGALDEGTVVTPSGWKTTGMFSAILYGASGGFPGPHVPGPPDRGRNFFTGGDAPVSTATQDVAVDLAVQGIDNQLVTYTLSGWLGGHESQEDNAAVAAEFLGTDGTVVGRVRIGPVTAADRKGATAFLFRTATGTVPKGSRRIRVTVTATRVDGASNDGYADNIALVLKWKEM